MLFFAGGKKAAEGNGDERRRYEDFPALFEHENNKREKYSKRESGAWMALIRNAQKEFPLFEQKEFEQSKKNLCFIASLADKTNEQEKGARG